MSSLLAGFGTAHGNGDAVLYQKMRERRDVGEAWDVRQRQFFRGEQRRRHKWERGIFCAADRYLALKRPAAADTNPIHENILKGCDSDNLAATLWRTSDDLG